jgi:hypothetical protein
LFSIADHIAPSDRPSGVITPMPVITTRGGRLSFCEYELVM